MIRPALPIDCAPVAHLHAAGISEGFLATLGPRFLLRLYRRISRSSHGFLQISEDDAGITGFIAVALSTRSLYREFVLRDGVPALGGALSSIARSPKRVWETLRYGTTTEDSLPHAEILSVAVAPRAQGLGLGTQLVTAATIELARRGVAEAKVVTASDNGPALRMYEKAGFKRVGETEVHRGIAQAVLVWR